MVTRGCGENVKWGDVGYEEGMGGWGVGERRCVV